MCGERTVHQLRPQVGHASQRFMERTQTDTGAIAVLSVRNSTEVTANANTQLCC